MRIAWPIAASLMFGAIIPALAGPAEWVPPPLTGTVVDEAGRPVPDVALSFRVGNRERTARGTRGEFRIPLEPSDLNEVGGLRGLIVARAAGGLVGLASVRRSDDRAGPIRVVLKPARRLTVTVVDARGAVVPGALVEFGEPLRPIGRARTDAAGSWVGEIPADLTDWQVSARKPGAGFAFALARFAFGRGPGVFHPLPAEIKLAFDGARTLRIRALDPEGRPIGGVRVFPKTIPSSTGPIPCAFPDEPDGTAITAADGTATLDWLPTRFRHSIQINGQHDAWYLPGFSLNLDSAWPDEGLTMRMLPLQFLSGRVTLAGGGPAAGALVIARGRNSTEKVVFARTHTDADGRYELQVGSEAAYVVAASRGDLAAPYRWDAVVRAGRPIDGLDLVLGPATLVRGRVLTSRRGAVDADAWISVSVADRPLPPELRLEGARPSLGIGMGRSTYPDDQGRYEIRLAPGEYTLSVPLGNKRTPLTIPRDAPPAEVVMDFEIPESAEAAKPAGLTSRPTPSTPQPPDAAPPERIHVTVVDEAGEDAKEAMITVRFWGRVDVPPDGCGRFLIPIGPKYINFAGRVVGTVTASLPDGRLGLARVNRIPGSTETIRVVLKPPSPLRVTVIDGDGRGVAGARVEVTERLVPILEGETDGSGHREGNIPADASDRQVSARRGGVGFDFASPPVWPSPLAAEVTLKLEGAATYRIRAVDRDGKPVAGVRALPTAIRLPDHPSAAILHPFPHEDDPVTGTDGRLTLDWLPRRWEGGPRVKIEHDSTYLPDPFVKLDAGEVVATMRPLARLAGRVMLRDGGPAVGFLVRAQGQGSDPLGFQASGLTDAAGRFVLLVAPESAYLVAAGFENQAAPYRSGVVVREARPVDGLDLTVGPATRVRGRVRTGPKGTPTPDMLIQVKADRGPIPPEIRREGYDPKRTVGMSWIARTDELGRYQVMVGPGEHMVRGPSKSRPVPLSIPKVAPPADLLVDFDIPGPPTGADLALHTPDRGQ